MPLGCCNHIPAATAGDTPDPASGFSSLAQILPRPASSHPPCSIADQEPIANGIMNRQNILIEPL